MQRGLVKTHDGRGLMRLVIPAVCSVAVHALSYAQSVPVIINEVLANEPGSAVRLEWVELYNRSVLPVDLSSYVFVDGVDSTVLTGLVLSPGGYAVLARYLAEEMDDATFESRWGDNSGVWGDSERERYPAMNAVMRLRNTADTVRLLAPDGATSTCRWESDMGDGISIERLRPESPDEPGSFRPSQEASGSTPGRINSRTPRDNDLAFDTAGVTVTPYPPREDNPVTFTFTVRNIGNGPSLENVLTASEDTNSDGLVDSNEVRATLNVPSLEEGGSILLSFTSRFTGGIHVVVLTLGADGNPANNTARHTFKMAYAAPELVINEYLADPVADGPEEWIELYNRSDHSVLFSGWQIRDLETLGVFISAPILLYPGQYAVVCENPRAFATVYPAVEAKFIGETRGWRKLNNTGDRIILVDMYGYVVDSLSYDTSYGGRSAERIDSEAPSGSMENWGGSLDPMGGTPGRINSRTPRPNDLAIDSAGLAIEPAPPREDQPVTLIIPVLNVGFGRTTANELAVADDIDLDGAVGPAETLAVLSVPSIEEAQSVAILFTGTLSGGIHNLILSLGADGNASNNVVRRTFKVAYAHPELVINEYLCDPAPDQSEEWIELYNRSDHVVNLASWRIGDALGQQVITRDSALIAPGAYVVVCEDLAAFAGVHPGLDEQLVFEVGGWRKLNNGGDRIVLLDPYGYVVDSLSYDTSYGGRSAERIDSEAPSGSMENWGGSLDPMGGTPGRVNSLTARPNDLAIDSNSVFIFPDPPREHSALQLVVIVTNVGKDTSRANMLTIVDDTDFDGEAGEGETLAVLEIPALVMKQADTVWYGGVLSGGVHRVLLFLGDDGNALNNTAVVRFKVVFAPGELVVINEFMAAPEAGGSEEWIELYNRSGHSVDIYGWRVGDSLAQQSISAESLRLQPGEFFLVCADTTALRARYDLLQTAPLCQMSGWRALNDTGDRIVLVDDFGYTVDALGYTESVAGRSWERVDPDERSDHPLNWRTSIDPAGATPGRINSMTRRANDLALDSNGIGIAPFPPLEGVAVMFSIRVRNCGLGASAANVLTIIETTQSAEGSHREDTLAMLPIPGMNVNDSLDLFSRQVFSGGRRTVACRLGGDDNALNNAAVVQFKVLFTRPEVVINEYLPDPATGGSEEWIELYNRSGHDVDLRNWRIGDSISQAVIAAEKKVLAPGSYAVVCENLPAFATAYVGIDPFLVVEVDGWRALNDTGDRIALVDDFGYLIDSLTYRTAYDGRSVERIDPERASGDPDNWWGSVDPAGATPGRRNSTAVGYADVLHVSVSPNPFIAGEQVHIDYAVPFRASLTARVYDVNGRKIKTLVENQPVASGALFWDGRDDEGRMLQPGAYVLLCETNSGQARKIVLAVRPTK